MTTCGLKKISELSDHCINNEEPLTTISDVEQQLD